MQMPASAGASLESLSQLRTLKPQQQQQQLLLLCSDKVQWVEFNGAVADVVVVVEL